MGDYVTVAATSDLAPGQGRVVEVAGTAIALFNIDGTFHALDNACPHRGGPLGAGPVEGEVVTCPWHGWRYRVTTGQHVAVPTICVKVHEVRVVGQDVQVRLR